MSAITKSIAAVGVAGLVALAAASPVEARNGRNAAAIGGFVAGAAIGAAVAGSSSNDSGPGYYDRYYYGPGYAYGPAYYEPGPYAYEGRVYVAPGAGRCWVSTDDTRGYGYYRAC